WELDSPGSGQGGLTTMKRHRHTPEQVVRKLREGERMLNEGTELVEVLRQLEISEATWNRWRNSYGGMKAEEAKRLRELERQNARRHPRWGYKLALRLLRREGWHVNRKRVQRLWREEGLKRPVQCRKRRRQRPDSSERLCAERPNHVWAVDFQFDETADGRRLKLLNVVDEYTREALAMRVGRRCDADDLVAVIEALVAERGAPRWLRMDNGPELI